MNNLPQYELIGAYLDGELDAAEAAQVERLLAADPAARQMLDEFRSLGAVLKNSLPRQSLPADLSARVLAAAERRMLDPDAAEPEAPDFAPAAPPWPRRLLNPRVWVWSGIAVALALAIAIGDRQQRRQPGGEPPRDIARTVVDRHAEKEKENEKTVAKAESRPTMQAAVEPENGTERPLAAAPRKGGAEASKDTVGMDAPQRAIMPPPQQSVRESMALDSLSSTHRRPQSGAPSGGDEFSGPPAAAPPAPASPAPTPRGRSDANWGAGGTGAPGFMADDNNDEQRGPAPKAVAAPPGVLVIHCNISPQAAKTRALDKLLAANGISLRREPDDQGRFDGRRDLSVKNQPPADGKAADKSQAEAKEHASPEKPKSIAGAGRTADAENTDEAERIYVEATEAQLRAALAGLSAQPDVFLSFSIQRSKADGGDEKSNAATRSEAAPRRRTMKSPGGPLAAPMAEPPAAALEELPQSAMNVALRRVLFVVRVVEPVGQAEAAKIVPAEKSQQTAPDVSTPPPAAEKPTPAQK
jgi:anti-sigma factor RsiW